MRVFYIFQIKEEFHYLYQDSPLALYEMLRQIYYLNAEDILYGKNIFKQLTTSIDKEKIDRELYIKLHQYMPYSKRGNTHFINNLYKEEISRLIVKHSYMKLEVESSFSSFFDYLCEFDGNYFACCFENMDFFFLDSAKTLV